MTGGGPKHQSSDLFCPPISCRFFLLLRELRPPVEGIFKLYATPSLVPASCQLALG